MNPRHERESSGEPAAIRRGLEDTAATGGGVLAGKRVLELGRVLAAPYAGQLLGDLGAEVIKIERPQVGDDARHYAQARLPAAEGRRGDSANFVSVNRNKQSLTLDLSQAEGQDILRRLAARSDVLIENFKTGTMSRQGLGYADLSAINPQLVYCSVTGYGQDGPYADRLGYDPIFQAMCGLMDLSAPEVQAGTGPQPIGVNILDFITGQYAAMAILVALYERDQHSGAGQYLDINLLDSAMATMSTTAQQFLITGDSPRYSRTGGVKTGPSGLLRCEDAGVWVIANRDAYFAAACRVLGCPELLANPDYKTQAQRGERIEELLLAFNARVAGRKALEVSDALNGAGVPASVVNDMRRCFDDPQIRYRDLAVPLPHPDMPDLRVVANPLRLASTPPTYRLAPPTLGQHTDTILHRLLGIDAAKIAELRATGVV